MSSSSKGTRREYDVIDSFIKHGFWYYKANRSGQCIKEERKPFRIPGDILVMHPEIAAFQIEVGGAGKRLGVEFAELRARLLPGFAPLVVMFKGGKRWYYFSEDERYPTVDALLAAVGPCECTNRKRCEAHAA